MAERIGINRTIAGVHYPVDTVAGAALGATIGKILWGLATDPGAGCDPNTAPIFSFDGTAGEDDDFYHEDLFNDGELTVQRDNRVALFRPPLTVENLQGSVFGALVSLAAAEWPERP